MDLCTSRSAKTQYPVGQFILAWQECSLSGSLGSLWTEQSCPGRTPKSITLALKGLCKYFFFINDRTFGAWVGGFSTGGLPPLVSIWDHRSAQWTSYLLFLPHFLTHQLMFLFHSFYHKLTHLSCMVYTGLAENFEH